MNELAKRLEHDIMFAHQIWDARAPTSYAKLRLSSYINDLLVALARERGDRTRADVLSVFHGMRVVVDSRAVGFVIEEDPERSATLDLGWANGWTDTPWVVEECRRIGHQASEKNLDPTHRGLKTEVRCELCNYVYYYDSSD